MDKTKPLLVKRTTQEEDELIKQIFTNETSHIKVGDHGYIFPATFREELNEIHNMPVRPSDIFVVSFPRSGTTWTQEMVWLIANDLDFETSKAIPLNERYLFPDLGVLFTDEQKETFSRTNELSQVAKEIKNSTIESLVNAPDPRFIKSHVALSVLPPSLLDTCKVVYVARDPRDSAVSYHHVSKLMNKAKRYTGEFKDFWNLLLKDLITWAPIFEHTKEAWRLRNHPNMMFLFYEEMSKDLPSVIRKVSSFLGKDYDEDQIQALAEHLNIDSFKKNKAVNLTAFQENGLLDNGEQFIRKGKVGGWREYFDAEMTRQAEEWMSRNLQDTDLQYTSS